MRHHDQDAGAVVEQLEGCRGQAGPLQELVQRSLTLQHDDPGAGAHQKRCPEWQQDEQHVDTHPARRQRRQEMRDRKGQQQADQRNRNADRKRRVERVEENGLLRGLRHDPARLVLLHVEGRQQEGLGEGPGFALDDAPPGGIGPLRVSRDHL